MKLFTFLNGAGEVLTVVGPTDIKPSIEQCPGAVSVVEGDFTTKGVLRATPPAQTPTETTEELKARLEHEITLLKARVALTESKVGVLESPGAVK